MEHYLLPVLLYRNTAAAKLSLAGGDDIDQRDHVLLNGQIEEEYGRDADSFSTVSSEQRMGIGHLNDY